MAGEYIVKRGVGMVNVRHWLLALFSTALVCSAVHAVTIGEVKTTYPDGASVFVRGVITYLTPTECYIQSKDRSAGIWAEADTTGRILGDDIYLTGDIATRSGERIIQRTYLYSAGSNSVAQPFAMLNRNLGGTAAGLQPGVDDRRSVRVPAGNGWTENWQWFPAAGPNNIGLLVKAWGTVKAVSQSAADGTKWFHIDDGSHVISDLGDWGVLVYSDVDVKQGDQVTVTGISSLEPSIDHPEKTVRVLRTRNVNDVQVTKAAEVWDPLYSDEFSSPVLNKRWAYEKRCGSISVSSNPGCLRLLMPENGDFGPSVILRLGSEFSYNKTISIRMRAEFSDSPDAYQGINVYTTCKPYGRMDDPSNYWMAGMSIHPQWGRLAVTATSNTPLVGNSIDITVKNGQITVTYPGLSKPLVGTMQGLAPFLVIAIHSTDPTPTGRPFAAYVDYFRATAD